MKVYLLRHGIAVPPGTTGVPEDDRPLTKEGIHELKNAGKGMKRLGISWDHIVTSPMKRAKQTAELAAEATGHHKKLVISPVLVPGAELREATELLQEFSDGDKVLLVGHEPHLGQLLGWWTTGREGGSIPLKKGGLAKLNFDLISGEGELRWLMTARLMAKIGA